MGNQGYRMGRRRTGIILNPLVFAFFVSAIFFAAPVKAEDFSDPFSVLGTQATPTGCLNSDLDNKALSLNDLLNIAICNNPTLATSYMQAKSAAASYGKALSAYLPSLNASANIKGARSKNTATDDDDNDWQSSSSVGASLTLSWLVYDFGAREADRDIAQKTLEQANFTKNQTLQDTVFNVISAYYSLLSAREALTVAKTNEETSLKSYQIALKKYDLGLVKLSDKLQAETSFGQSQYAVAESEAALTKARGKLAELLNLSAATELDLAEVTLSVEDGKFEGDPKELIAEALARRADIKASEAATAAAKLAIDKAEAANYPSISFSSSATATDNLSGGSGQSYSGNIGLGISVPLFTGFANTYNTIAKRYDYQAQMDKLAALESSIRQDVWNKYQDYITSVKNYDISQKLFISASESFKVADGAYKAGKGNILELLNAQSALAEARKEKSSSLYDLLLAKNDLLRAIGKVEI